MKKRNIKIGLLALLLTLACTLALLPTAAFAAGNDGEEPSGEATGTWDEDTQASNGHFLMAVPSSKAAAYSNENVRIVECNLITVFDWVTFGNGDDPIPYNATVDVQLLCDGKPYETATLSAAERNGWGEIAGPSTADWEYPWFYLQGDHAWTVELADSKLPYSYEHIGTKYGEYVHVVTTSSGEKVGYKYMVCSIAAATERCRREPSAWDRPVSVRKVWFDRYQKEAPAVPSDVYVGATFEASPGGFTSFPSDTYEDGIMLGASNEYDGWHHVFTFGDGGAYGRFFVEQSGGDYQKVIVEHFWEDYPDYPIQSAAVIVNITPPKGEAGPTEPTYTYTPGFRVTKQVGTAVQDSAGNWSLVDGSAEAGDQKFEFVLKFYSYSGKPLAITKGDEKYYKYTVTSANGKELSSGYLAKMGDDTGCRVELGAGDTVTVYNMDGKSIIKRYTIEESRCDGYEPNVLTGGKLTPDGLKKDPASSRKFVAGTDTVSGMLDSQYITSVTYINTPEPEPSGYEFPKTGGDGAAPYAIGGMAAVSVGIGGPLLIGRKRRHEDDQGGAEK